LTTVTWIGLARRAVLIYLALTSEASHSQSASAQKHYELGRLFMDPGQRAQIDQPTKIGASGSNEVAQINGVVQRSAGPSVVWIDGVPRQDWPIVAKRWVNGKTENKPNGPVKVAP
jgi:hypothetical protein